MRYHSNSDIEDYILNLEVIDLQLELMAVIKTLFNYYYESIGTDSQTDDSSLFFMSLYHYFDRAMLDRRGNNGANY